MRLLQCCNLLYIWNKCLDNVKRDWKNSTSMNAEADKESSEGATGSLEDCSSNKEDKAENLEYGKEKEEKNEQITDRRYSRSFKSTRQMQEKEETREREAGTAAEREKTATTAVESGRQQQRVEQHLHQQQ